jgi:hypothetical protein
MSHGVETAAPQTLVAASNVVALSEAGLEKSDTCGFAIGARLAGFVSGSVQDGSEQWFQSFLSQLRPGESLSLRVAFADRDGLSFGATACGPQDGIEARSRELELALREVAASAAPYLKLAPQRALGASEPPYAVDLKPAGRRVCLDDLVSDAPRRVATSGASNPEAAVVALQLALSPDRRPDLAAVADLMSRPALRGAVLHLELSTFALEARHRRAIQEFLKGLVRASRAAGLEIPLILLNDRVLPLLKAWSTASRGLRLSARLCAGEAVSGAVLDMLCQALFGSTRRVDSEEAAVDLTAAWPDLDLAFLGRLPLIPAIKARLAARDKASSAVERSRGITLGRLDDDLPFAIDAMARKQHVYVLGGTGTGKSTLMLNMIVQDMKAGRAVIVVDPHGDLWEKAQRLVPSKRLQDLVLVHPTDPRGQFTMNILERLSDDAEGEHGRVIDELLDFLKRSQWRDVPEAFGPMFENYFRNGLQLLLSAEGDDASILDFPRVFSDEGFRSKLLGKCKNADVRLFWRGIVEGAQYEAKLSNHAPYIVCKVSPIVGNVHLRRILGARNSTLDFGTRPALRVANQVLGGGMSSRLFQEVREQRGLAYSVFSNQASFEDAGFLALYAGTAPARVTETLDVLRAELDRLRRDALTDAELEAAKGHLTGSLAMSLETSAARMRRLGRAEMVEGDVPSLDELVARIEAVGHDEVGRVIERVLTDATPTLAVVGPHTESDFT